jgi:N utilization substance protein B
MQEFLDENDFETIPETFPDDFDPEQDKIIERVVVDDMELDDRTRARGIALQSLYEMDMSSHPINIILKERTDSVHLDPAQVEMIEKIVSGVLPYIHQIDGIVSKYAPEWPIDQIAVIDRNIIRIAVWEFAIGRTAPVKVAINESVELAKMFGSESSPRFVNGVLGSIVAHLDELIARSK